MVLVILQIIMHLLHTQRGSTSSGSNLVMHSGRVSLCVGLMYWRMSCEHINQSPTRGNETPKCKSSLGNTNNQFYDPNHNNTLITLSIVNDVADFQLGKVVYTVRKRLLYTFK